MQPTVTIPFQSFGKIEQFGKLFMTITQKIHGTNAQIFIDDQNFHVGSRTRWLREQEDNYGFYRWANSHKELLIQLLGRGRHYGEWAGPGINAGEGLTEPTFILFNHHRKDAEELHAKFSQLRVVPILYQGLADMSAVFNVMQRLKEHGSELVPGYMHPEGIVIEMGGNRYKKVFKVEETQWIRKKERSSDYVKPEVDYLLQPIRLEKLLSRDEQYRLNYPETLPSIAKAYIQDLIDENQIKEDYEEIKSSLARAVFHFIKETINV